MSTGTLGAIRREVWGTTAELLVTEPSALEAAAAILDAELGACTLACSRFVAHSELIRCNAEPEVTHHLSEVLVDYLRAAERGYQLSNGLVDPTIGAALLALGYDRDFDALTDDGAGVLPLPAVGFDHLDLNLDLATLRLLPGQLIDLGATAKAHCADRVAQAVVRWLDVGVLVNLGGDLALAGPPPAGGWVVGVTPSAKEFDGPTEEAICLDAGGVATSSTTVRTWLRGGQLQHHLINPATGTPADSPWARVTVLAGSALDANIAATAAHLQGEEAPFSVAQAGLGARFVRHDGAVEIVGVWPRGAS